MRGLPEALSRQRGAGLQSEATAEDGCGAPLAPEHDAGGDIVMTKTTRFDAADYLDTEERQVAYVAAALESGDADFVRDALGLVARARGMGGIAKKAGLNRESLYKALGETGNPEFGTVMRIVRALGLTLSARPATSGQTSKRRRVA
jgi:probable addiction module antidote protein